MERIHILPLLHDLSDEDLGTTIATFVHERDKRRADAIERWKKKQEKKEKKVRVKKEKVPKEKKPRKPRKKKGQDGL